MKIIDAITRAQRSAPVDIEGLAGDLGIRVNTNALDDDVSGELVRISPDKYEIHLNENDSKSRRRFTLAHELGHFIYHKDLVGEGLDDDKAYRSTNVGHYHNTRIGRREETQANKFAAKILMPSKLIEELQAEGLSRKQVAQKLQVSEHALAIRLGETYP